MYVIKHISPLSHLVKKINSIQGYFILMLLELTACLVVWFQVYKLQGILLPVASSCFVVLPPFSLSKYIYLGRTSDYDK